MRIRNMAMAAVLGLVLAGAGAAIAQSQSSPSPSGSSSRETEKSASRSAFLDDVADRLGISRAKLDAALRAMALDKVQWAEDNAFITEAEADALRQRIESDEDGDIPHLGFFGHFGLGFGGLPFDGHRLGGSRDHHSDGDLDVLAAAANYLGLSSDGLLDALGSKTLARIAQDRGKSIAGLEQAMRAATKSQLDQSVSDGEITQAQGDALLARFDEQIDDVINGISPALTDLAERLGVDRDKLVDAVKGAAIDQVDSALEEGSITQAQADAIKERIRSGSGFPLGGLGLCGGLGHMGGVGFDLDREIIGV